VRRFFLLLILPLLTACSLVSVTLLDDTGSIRIAHISDLHIREADPVYRTMIARLNAENPDLILMTGDLVVGDAGVPILADIFSGYTGGAPIFAVIGNWETGTHVDIGSMKASLAEAGITLLINEGLTLSLHGRRVAIHGFDDFLLGAPDFATYVPDPDALNIVMGHEPIVFDRVNEKYGEDIPLHVFSGHTHGGQITLFGTPLVLPNGSGDYVHGEYRKGLNTLYVSRGIGTSTINLRICADPEILLVSL